MKKRLQAIAAVIPVSLDPEGSFGDHLRTIEYKVYERKGKGTFNQRLAKLEWEFETLEDYTDLFMIDSNEPLFPVNNESPSPSDEECTHKDEKHKISNICCYTYLFFAFLFLLGPVQGLMWEMCKGIGSTFIDLAKHLETYWTSLYLPLFAPMSWITAGYLACCLSRPKPVSTIELASTYVPRHLRRNTKAMRRKQRKMAKLKSKSDCEIDVSGLGEFVKRNGRFFNQKPITIYYNL